MITKYGYSVVAIIAIISIVLIIIGILSNNYFLKYGLISFSILLMIFTLNFFRDPDRNTPELENIVVSPADGKVLFVKEIIDNRFINGNAKIVAIFMSPLNVHVNRIPISGKIKYLKYHPGQFIAAFEEKASEKNERNEIGIESKFGKVLFIQIAGFVARRIVSDLKIGDEVKIGERFGMIRFGSRVDVIVPSNWTPKVKENDIVRAGETILFEIK
ncbi:MAG: phosphatidylserine decarboxylase family protein [Ignavibacterium sp.]|nr:phosphatidylserine decarboxylase family protein [Ignavibacterium sp.]MCX7611289.1 phosphatidylserine decarboxylase family protein [Ignavibacterium sp.]MDW8375641.1 phosphatidylserine decarboxylase family protein [Ignavibacteriales bacterium]